MAEDQEQTAIRTLLQENQRLKQRLFEAEEKIRKMAPPSESHSSSGSSVMKLIEHKDFQLEQARARLEEKKEQLEEVAREVERLRLYREIFDNDSTAMIGVNHEGVVSLYNRAASLLLGEKLKESLQKPIESVDFGAFDPDTAKRVRQALASRKRVDSAVDLRDSRVQTWVRPVESESEVRGAVLHILAISRK
jgi:PAS domain-containing protein